MEDNIVTVWGKEYNLTYWPYGTLRPFYIKTDEEFIEDMIEDGFATARLLYMRDVYTSEEMIKHMSDAIESPLFGCLCPHRVLPDNCSRCCGREPEYWMRP